MPAKPMTFMLHSVRASLVGLLVVLSGCVTVSQKAARVQFHGESSAVLASCQRVGPVTASLSRFAAVADDKISLMLREAAADLGADSVLVLNRDETLSTVQVQGMALKCYP